MFIDGPRGIGYLCLNMRIESNEVLYNIELQNQDFETQAERHEEKSTFEEAVDKSS